MTTINVSGQSELVAALRTASAGDTLSLAGGNYGSVTLAKYASGGDITITSASDTDQAVFSKIKGKDLDGLTIDNVKFEGIGGAGAGVGLTISNSTDVKVVNSDFSDFKVASFLYSITGMTVSNNTFTNMYHDAMDFTEITNGVISKNTYTETNSQPGYTHKDFIQFWTNAQYDQSASKNIQITNNAFFSDDGQTHGIFINNEVGTEKYENITIANNYLQSSHTHGITVDYADNLTIDNNTVVKDGSGTPVINVTPDSTNVAITNNTTPGLPNAGNSTWTITGNNETANAWQWTDGKSGSSVSNSGSTAGSTTTSATTGEPTSTTTHSGSATPASPAPAVSDLKENTKEAVTGTADFFHLKGGWVDGTMVTNVHNLDFREGDSFSFIDYDKGTFDDVNGGNKVGVNAIGTYANIDSITDLQELVTHSDAITAKVSGDDLTLTIKQDSGTHDIVLAGLGHDYQNTFDSALF